MTLFDTFKRALFTAVFVEHVAPRVLAKEQPPAPGSKARKQPPGEVARPPASWWLGASDEEKAAMRKELREKLGRTYVTHHQHRLFAKIHRARCRHKIARECFAQYTRGPDASGAFAQEQRSAALVTMLLAERHLQHWRVLARRVHEGNVRYREVLLTHAPGASKNL